MEYFYSERLLHNTNELIFNDLGITDVLPDDLNIVYIDDDTCLLDLNTCADRINTLVELFKRYYYSWDVVDQGVSI